MPVLKKGAKGPGVKYVQQLLNKNGAKPKLDINGVFDETMREAVKVFQKRQSLKPDGIVGEDTVARLEGKPTKAEQRLAKYTWPYQAPKAMLKDWDKVYLANYDRNFDEIPALLKTTDDRDLKIGFEMDYKKLETIVREAYRAGRDLIVEMLDMVDSLDIAKFQGREKTVKAILKRADASMKALHRHAQDRDHGIAQQDMRIKRFRTQVKLAAKRKAA